MKYELHVKLALIALVLVLLLVQMNEIPDTVQKEKNMAVAIIVCALVALAVYKLDSENDLLLSRFIVGVPIVGYLYVVLPDQLQ
jgi:hypothetical protein